VRGESGVRGYRAGHFFAVWAAAQLCPWQALFRETILDNAAAF